MKNFQFIFYFLIFISCKKHGNGYVEGHAYEEGYNIPFSNATVSLEEAFHGNQGSIIKTTTTDANGYYRLNFKSRLQYRYYLHILKPNCEGITISLETKKTTLTNYIATNSFVKFDIKNNLPTSVSFFLNNVYLNQVTANSNSTAVLRVKGYGPTDYSWYYRKGLSGDTSVHHLETISIYSKTDTVYKTLEIN